MGSLPCVDRAAGSLSHGKALLVKRHEFGELIQLGVKD